MQPVEREVSAMCKSDDHVSPYLRRPVRTYDEYLRDKTDHAPPGRDRKTGDADERSTDDKPRR
jgi:hypothetical protein